MKSRGLPLFTVLFRAIAFEILNLFTVFRLTWLPLAVLLATQVVIGNAVVTMSGATSEEAFKELGLHVKLFYASGLVQGLALSVVAVRVHRLILFGDKRPGEYFAFPFGATELQYFAMGALTLAAMATVMVGGAMAAFGFYDAVGWDLTKGKSDESFAMTLIKFVPMIALIVAVYWVLMRLSLWPPATVAEGITSLPTAWRLTRGNAFNLFWLLQIAGLVLLFSYGGFLALIGQLEGVPPFFNLIDRYELFGVITMPRWERFATLPTPDILLREFAIMFFASTFIVANLSYAYLALRDAPQADSETPEGASIAPAE